MVAANLLAIEDDFWAIFRYQGPVGREVKEPGTFLFVDFEPVVRAVQGSLIENHFPYRTHNFF